MQFQSFLQLMNLINNGRNIVAMNSLTPVERSP